MRNQNDPRPRALDAARAARAFKGKELGLSGLCDVGSYHFLITPPPPERLRDNHRAKKDAELYLMIGTDLVFPLARVGEDSLDAWVAKTCVARGGMSDEARRRRNACNAMRRRSRREKRSWSSAP